MKRRIHLLQRPSSRIVGLLLSVGALGVLATSDALHAVIADGIRIAEPFVRAQSIAGLLAFMVLALLSSMLVFVSSVVLVPLGVAVWGRPACVALLWLSWFLGGVLTYTIGRRLGRRAVLRFVAEDKLEAYAARIPGEGAFFAAFAIQLSVPSDVAGYAFGIVKFPRVTYLAALALAELPYAVGTVYLGDAFLEQNYLLLGGAAAALLASILIARATRARKTKPAPG